MIIGIDGSRAFLKQRTGIEEYSYQTVKNLRQELGSHNVFLYVRKNQTIDFEIPENWTVKRIGWPRLWTQVGLSLEMFLHPADVLFVPAHTVPWIHPARNSSLFRLALGIQRLLKFLGINTYYNEHSDAGGPAKTIVTVHGLEYEIMPKAYSFWERMYMRLSIRNSCRWASKIISVSENTKKDLMRLYQVPEEKTSVVYEGYEKELRISNSESRNFDEHKPYLLFVGRLEERKNIVGIVKTFEILKEKYGIPHKLVLAGKPGYGYDKIKSQISRLDSRRLVDARRANLKSQNDIVMPGFVKDENKSSLMAGADVFLFPTFYEGFGIPILEAQSVGVPVVASNISSLPEVAGDAALLVDPENPEEIAESVHRLISDKSLKDDIIRKGYENVKRFSWEKCAREIAGILTK